MKTEVGGSNIYGVKAPCKCRVYIYIQYIYIYDIHVIGIHTQYKQHYVYILCTCHVSICVQGDFGVQYECLSFLCVNRSIIRSMERYNWSDEDVCVLQKNSAQMDSWQSKETNG